MIKCLIFDLDGTLVDTLKDLCVCSNEILKEYNYQEIEFNKFRYFVGNGIKKLLEICIIDVNGDLSLLDEIYNKFTINYENNCLRFAKLYPNIKELLDILKKDNYLLFVNTNKNDETWYLWDAHHVPGGMGCMIQRPMSEVRESELLSPATYFF